MSKGPVTTRAKTRIGTMNANFVQNPLGTKTCRQYIVPATKREPRKDSLIANIIVRNKQLPTFDPQRLNNQVGLYMLATFRPNCHGQSLLGGLRQKPDKKNEIGLLEALL